jgi:hypothetical protein
MPAGFLVAASFFSGWKLEIDSNNLMSPHNTNIINYIQYRFIFIFARVFQSKFQAGSSKLSTTTKTISSVHGHAPAFARAGKLKR